MNEEVRRQWSALSSCILLHVLVLDDALPHPVNSILLDPTVSAVFR